LPGPDQYNIFMIIDRQAGAPGRIIIFIALIAVAACGPKPSETDRFKQHLAEAKLAMSESKYPAAIKSFRKALQIHENDAEVHFDIAGCFEKIGLADSAILYYEGSIIFNPNNILAYEKIGDIYYKRQDWHEARSWYDRGMELGRLKPSSNLALGNIHYRWREWVKARDYFLTAARGDSSNAEAHLGLGLSRLSLGDTTLAIADLEKAVELASFSKAMFYLGMAEFNRNRFADSERWLTMYLDREPLGEFGNRAKEYLRIIAIKKRSE